MATETLEWVEADGTTTAWPVEQLRGMEGRGLPPVKHRLEEVPNRPGALLRNTRDAMRRVVIPTLFQGEDTVVRALLREWAYRLHAARGPGKLRVSCVDGSQREVGAVYAGGLELIEETAWNQPATVEFVCSDPYWQDTADSTVSAMAEDTTVAWFPFFPLLLAPSSVAVSATVTNDGDVDVWPLITLTGPMTDPIIENATTGKQLVLVQPIDTGATVVLDAGQDARTVSGPAGENWYLYLSNESEWWPIARGANVINIQATGTAPGSQVQMSWRRKWLTV